MMSAGSAKSEVRGAGWWDAGVLIPALRTPHFALLLCVLALWPTGPLAAQVIPTTIDTLPSDSARADSLRREATARLLAAAENTGRAVAAAPLLGSEGPRALGSRIILDRRAIAWQTAQTVSDLLSGVPGVYIWRGGWHGREAYANYRGRGATGVEFVIDGVPFVPMGPDSVGVDPSTFSLSLFERVEIERWPGGLKVLLYTPQYQYLAPRTRVGITTGQFDIARYQGDLEYRWKNGLGLTVAADYFHSPTATGVKTDATIVHGLVRAQYIPRPGFGMQVQLLRLAPTRHAFQTDGDSISAPLKGTRNDLQARVFARKGTEERHLQADLLYFRSTWASDTFRLTDSVAVSDSVDQEVHGGALILALRRPRWRVGASAWLRDKWTPLTVRGEGGYTPFDRLSLNGEVTHERHDGDRTSDWIGLRAGLTLPLGFEGEGGWRTGSRVIAPALASDTAAELHEVELRGRWRSRYLTLEAGWSRTAAFTPYRFAPYIKVDSLRPLGTTEWLEYAATLTPLNWMTLSAWYSDPRNVTIDGIPPTHSVIRGEIRSKFLRKFPSGIFELRLAAEMENWGTGVIGRGPAGEALELNGATFVRMGAAMRLGGFQFFYDRTNTQSSRHSYVPGFKIPGLGQTFGMRWEFSN